MDLAKNASLEIRGLGDRRSQRAIEVLRVLSEAAAVNFDYPLARSAWRDASARYAETSEAWAEKLRAAGEEIGLRISIVEATSDQIVEWTGPDGPAVTWVDQDEFLIVADRNGPRIQLLDANTGARRWVQRGQLAKMLPAATDSAPRLWVIAHATLPCRDAAAAPADADGKKQHSHGHASHSDDHGNHPTPQRRLLRLFKPEADDVWTVVAFSAAVGILMLATPIAVQALVNNIAFGVLLTPVVVLSLLLFAFLTLAAALRAVQTWVVEILQRRIFARVVADLAYRLPRVRYDSFDREHGPELVNRFFDVLTVQKVSASLLLDGVAIVLQTAIGLGILAFYNPFLLGFDIALVIAMAILVLLLGKGAVRTSIDESIAKYDVAGWLEEMARHPLAFRLNGGRNFAIERADSLTKQYLLARKAHFQILFRQIAFALMLQALASTALLGLGGWLVIEGQLTIGQLVAAELIVTTIVGSVAKFGKHMEAYYDLMAAVDKLGHLIDLPMERIDGSDRTTGERPASLSLVDIDFAYDDGPPVFSKFRLQVEPGERVAVVGCNGSGKTTLVDLIFGLRTPNAGHIELDGVDLRELRLDDLRAQVAAVKGTEVLEATVLDNVRMGRESVSAGDVRKALADVGLLDDVLALPMGLHTRLTTGGAPLSNGQARRLSLARAIVAKPRLLVVDETMDGVDDEVRARIHEAILSRAAPWTLLVVTHNESLFARCDRIIDLDETTNH